MPWRLIKFIIIFAVLLLFIVFNLDNKSDIGFGFAKIRDAPVYLVILLSILAGMLFTLPFINRRNKKNSIGKKTNTETEGSGSPEEDPDRSHYGID